MMLSIATFNLCNLGSDAPPQRLERLAGIVVQALENPDILAVQEIKATAGAGDNGKVPADAVYQAIINAIITAGGPNYEFREIPPLANRDGGMAGANIRSGWLFNPQRVKFMDRGNACPEEATDICITAGRPLLTLSPGRIAPAHPAFSGRSNRHWVPSRKALAGEFCYAGERLFLIVCHLKSMRAPTRREADYAKKQRHAQAEIIHHFVARLLSSDPQAHVVVLGDMNDVPGSKTLKLIKGNLLHNLLEDMPRCLCYTRRHGGRPQALDHVLVSRHLSRGARVRIAHVNSDSTDPYRVSDHDPVLVQINLKCSAGGFIASRG